MKKRTESLRKKVWRDLRRFLTGMARSFSIGRSISFGR